jgi:hypothetical protein
VQKIINIYERVKIHTILISIHIKMIIKHYMWTDKYNKILITMGMYNDEFCTTMTYVLCKTVYKYIVHLSQILSHNKVWLLMRERLSAPCMYRGKKWTELCGLMGELYWPSTDTSAVRLEGGKRQDLREKKCWNFHNVYQSTVCISYSLQRLKHSVHQISSY